MAAAAGRLLVAATGSWVRVVPSGGLHKAPALTLVPSHSLTVTRSGAILPKPIKVSGGEGRRAGTATNRRALHDVGFFDEREHWPIEREAL